MPAKFQVRARQSGRLSRLSTSTIILAFTPTLMASSLLSIASKRIPSRSSPLFVRHASGRPESGVGDPKKDNLRRVLYPSNIRSKPSPTGTWRPDVETVVQTAVPSAEAHETIERAWLLHQRHIRKRREEERERKFARMKTAMDALHELDPALYREAKKQDDPRKRSEEEIEKSKTMRAAERRAAEARIRGLFPRELRAPTETPSKSGWNYNYKPVGSKS